MFEVPKDFQGIRKSQRREQYFQKVSTEKKNTSLKQPDSVDVPPTHTDRVDLSHYDNSEKLNGLKQRLDLPETATIEEVERVFRLRLQESMKMYETLGKLNLEKI